MQGVGWVFFIYHTGVFVLLTVVIYVLCPSELDFCQYCGSCRSDTYESFAIYEFFALLKLYMGGDAECYAKLRRRPPMRHLFPLGFLPPFRCATPTVRKRKVTEILS